ncbi:MAG: radical SAM protein [Jatrophihabitantaceae bacterium]
MPELYFANVNYLCNERCVFCAAGLADGPRRTHNRPRGVTTNDITTWLAGTVPSPGDQVMIAGGEPTLHPRLTEIVRQLTRGGAGVTLFTNGLRLVDTAYVDALLDAGVDRFQISLYGARASGHEAITRRPGSFDTTLRALIGLSELRASRTFTVEVRLLAARQTLDENPDIVRLIAAVAPQIDRMSLHRLIFSADAQHAESAVTWQAARQSLNECLRLIRRAGFDAGFDDLPLCVLDDDNLTWAIGRLTDGSQRGARSLHYLDPFTASGTRIDRAPPQQRTWASDPCTRCSLASKCSGPDEWYLERFGAGDLHPILTS